MQFGVPAKLAHFLLGIQLFTDSVHGFSQEIQFNKMINFINSDSL